MRAPEVPEDQLFSEEQPWRWAAFGGGAEVLVGDAGAPGEVSEAAGDHRVVAHNAKALRTVPRTLAHDTEVAAYLLDPARRGYPLEELAQDHGLGADVDDPTGADALIICALAALQRERLVERGLDRLLLEVELPLVHVLREMEIVGVKLDCELLARISERVQGEVLELEHEIYDLAGDEFHIGSPQQLAEVLFEQARPVAQAPRQDRLLDRRARAAGDPRRARDHPQDRALPRAHQARPDLPGRAAGLCDPAARLHTTFNQTIAATGRLSSTDPNLQNIPIRTELGREIRACFVAEQGNVLISADYSQVELRVLAHVADEPVLKEIFRRGEDVHAATAAEVLGADPETLSPGDALQGQDDQLRHRLRADRLRPGRPAPDPPGRGPGVHRPLPGALPGRARLHRPHHRLRHHRGLRDHAVRPPPRRSPSSRRASARCARWASGWPSTR